MPHCWWQLCFWTRLHRAKEGVQELTFFHGQRPETQHHFGISKLGSILGLWGSAQWTKTHNLMKLYWPLIPLIPWFTMPLTLGASLKVGKRRKKIGWGCRSFKCLCLALFHGYPSCHPYHPSIFFGHDSRQWFQTIPARDGELNIPSGKHTKSYWKWP